MNGKILLIKIFRHPIRQWSIEMPRGFGEVGLSPEEIAQKEISEEVNGKIRQVISLGILHGNTGLEANNVHLYLAYLENTGEPQKSEGIEKMFWVSVNELENMIAQNQITDAFTISAYARAKIMGLLQSNKIGGTVTILFGMIFTHIILLSQFYQQPCGFCW